MTNAVLFWTVAVIVTGFVLLALVPPLLGRGRGRPGRPGEPVGESLDDRAGEPGRAGDREQAARALYRGQLEQVESDLARRRISAADAELARAEIGRRLLRAGGGAAQAAVATEAPRRAGRGRLWAAGVTVAAPLAAFGLYLALGQPDLPDQPLADRKDVADAAQLRASAEALANEMAVAVERNAEDLRSWVMLARALATLDRLEEAAAAYAHAIALAPDQADLSAAYGEVLVRQAAGQVTGQAAEAFQATLRQVPDDPRARYYMALRRFQQGDLRLALAEWRALAADSPPDAGWMDTVRSRIAETELALGPEAAQLAEAAPATRSAAPALGRGDSAADSGSAEPVSAEPEPAEPEPGDAESAVAESAERESGVPESGVPDSAARDSGVPDSAARDSGDLASADAASGEGAPSAAALADAGQRAGDPAEAAPPPPAAPALSGPQIAAMLDLPPDQQAARIAGMVGGLAARLEQNPEDVDGWLILARSYVALGDLAAAENALAKASEYGPDRIDAQIAYARMMLEGQPLDAPVPPEAVEAFRRVIAADPAHPDALWFLGLAAAQQRDFATARARWTQLLDTLDPRSEAYVDVQSYIAALSGGGRSGAAEEAAPADSGPAESPPAESPVDSTNAQ